MGLNWEKMKKDWNNIQEFSEELEKDSDGNEKSEKTDFSDILGLDDEEKSDSGKERSESYRIKKLEARVEFLEETVETLIRELDEEKSHE